MPLTMCSLQLNTPWRESQEEEEKEEKNKDAGTTEDEFRSWGLREKEGGHTPSFMIGPKVVVVVVVPSGGGLWQKKACVCVWWWCRPFSSA